MKRHWVVFIPFIFLLWGCVATTPTGIPPAFPRTATRIPPVHFETNSVPAGGLETLPPKEIKVSVYFTIASDVAMTPMAVGRTVPNSENFTEVIRSTLGELLKGPNAIESAQGLASWFSPATANSLASVSFSGDALAADFNRLNTIIPNASTSAGSQMLLSQLNSTLFQFPPVHTVRYSLNGDCAAFWEWLQFECHPVTRADWETG